MSFVVYEHYRPGKLNPSYRVECSDLYTPNGEARFHLFPLLHSSSLAHARAVVRHAAADLLPVERIDALHRQLLRCDSFQPGELIGLEQRCDS